MIFANPPPPRREVVKISAPMPNSVNVYDPIVRLPNGDYPILDNVLIRGGAVRTRPLLVNKAVSSDIFGNSEAQCRWQSNGMSFGIWKIAGSSLIQYTRLGTGEEFKSVYATTGVLFSATNVVLMVPIDDRVFVFRSSGVPYVIEYSTTNNRLEARLSGFPSVSLGSVSTISASGAKLSGDYAYGVELVRLDTDGRLIASGGISRVDSSGELFGSVTVVNGQAVVVVPNMIHPSNWTHVRLWRTKRLDLDPDSGVVRGQQNVMYLIQQKTKDEWDALSQFQGDATLDEYIPSLVLGGQVATGDVFELSPLPSASIVHFAEDRLWMANTSLPEDTGKDIYLSKPNSLYAESYSVLDTVRAAEQDSGPIQGIFSQNGDIIVCRETETGRIASSDTTSRYYVTDRSIGFKAGRIGSVPGIGVMAMSYSGDVYLLDGALQWGPVISGSQSRLRGAFTPTETVLFSTYDSSLLVHGKTTAHTYLLNDKDGAGWTRQLFRNFYGDLMAFQAIWDDPEGRGAYLLYSTPSGAIYEFCQLSILPSIQADWVSSASGDQSYNPLTMESEVFPVEACIQSPPFQDSEGRSVFEHIMVSIIGSLNYSKFSVSAIGPDRDTVLDTSDSAPNLTEYNTDEDLFLEHTYTPKSPISGSRVGYKLTSFYPFIVTSIQVEAMVSNVTPRGYQPEQNPTMMAGKDPMRDRIHWITRGYPDRDILTGVRLKEIKDLDYYG